MDINELKNRFSYDILHPNEKILILVGSGVSLNTKKEGSEPNGIGTTQHYISKFNGLLKKKLSSERKKLSEILETAKKSKNTYSYLAQAIIDFDKHTKGINDIFKEEIIPIIKSRYVATLPPNDQLEYLISDKNTCEEIVLNSGLEAFGKIAKYFKSNTRIITSNFDPFLEISLKKNGIDFLQFSYSYNLTERKDVKPSKNEIIIEHYHGYWLEDTAHTDLEGRKNNKDEFKKIIEEYNNIYLFGFGGWKDAFSEALLESLDNTSNKSIVHWAFYDNEDEASKHSKESDFELLEQVLGNHKRCNAYFNIDSNQFFDDALANIRLEALENALKDYKDQKIDDNRKSNNEVFKTIPYRLGKLGLRNEKSKIAIEEQIMLLLKEDKSVVVCSKFGLGKSTILENFLVKWLKEGEFNYGIFLNLAYYELSNLVKEENSISKAIFNQLNKDSFLKEYEPLLTTISSYLSDKRILLILDSIDESVFKDEELEIFREKLKGLGFPVLTSIRLEFHEFIDNAVEFGDWEYRALEVLEWPVTFLKNYFKSTEFDKSKRKEVLKLDTLNKRPIFLNLLNRLNLSSIQEISDNISSLYFHTISNAIEYKLESCFDIKDIQRRTIYKREYLGLLNSIAIAIYLEFQHYKYEEVYQTKPRVTFTSENVRLLVSKNRFLDFEKVKQLLDHESEEHLPIVKKVAKLDTGKGDLGQVYTFYHRSFFEYLVANGAAHRILRDSKCSEAWDVYQTDEVSEYFVKEVERQNVLTDPIKKENFFNAFDLEFLDIRKLLSQWGISKEGDYPDKKRFNLKYKQEKFDRPIVQYSERLEEVLYYVGKFKEFWTDQQKSDFERYCKFFFHNSRLKFKDSQKNLLPALDPIYYRTSAITLSRLINNRFIFDYISYVIGDYLSRYRLHYYTQVNKDIRYYGKQELREKCILSFEQVLRTINEDDLKPLQILKLFSLFISIWYKPGDDSKKAILDVNQEYFEENIKLLERLKIHVCKHEFENISDIIEGIEFVLQDIGFDTKFSEVNLEDKLQKALEKRKDLGLSVMRLVNSKGDDLDYLEIDYYNGHIIIDTKKEYYYQKRNLIADRLKRSLENLPIESIGFKYKEDFELSSRYSPELKLENLYGNCNRIIDCYEVVKFKVIPLKFPKTGFFIDNRKIRQFLEHSSNGKRVLNLCAFTCTLGVIARLNGAKSVVNVEKEPEYLKRGRQNYDYNEIHVPNQSEEFILTDIREYFRNNGRKKFDLIILDLAEISPAPCNFLNTKEAYKEHNLNALKMLSKNGILITSCCSHGFSRKRFKTMLNEILNDHKQFKEIGNLELDQLEDHPVKKGDVLSDYLKITAIQRME